MATPPKLYTFKEAQPLIRRSPSWLYQAAREGRIQFTELGGSLFLSEDDIAANIRNGVRPARGRKKQQTSDKADAPAKASKRQMSPAKKSEEVEAAEPHLRLVPGRSPIPQADPTASRKYRVTGTTPT